MSVSIPQPFHSVIDGPVNVSLSPSKTELAVTSLPVLHLAYDNKITLGVDPVELRLTQFPSIRGHLPVDMCVGLSLFGVDLASIRLCGEAQIITEPYTPGRCERCGPQSFVPGSTNQPVEAPK